MEEPPPPRRAKKREPLTDRGPDTRPEEPSTVQAPQRRSRRKSFTEEEARQWRKRVQIPWGWVTLAEYAAREGLTYKGAQSRVNRGQVESKLVGGVLYVNPRQVWTDGRSQAGKKLKRERQAMERWEAVLRKRRLRKAAEGCVWTARMLEDEAKLLQHAQRKRATGRM